MTIFIIFIILLIVGYHSYNTRHKLVVVAKALDEVDALLNQGIIEDRARIDKLEHKSKSQKKI